MTHAHSEIDRTRPLAWPWALLMIAVLALAVLWPLVGSPFAMWDDAEQIESNPNLHPPSLGALLDCWARPSMNIYIPLTNTVWYAIAAVGGADPESPTHGLRAWPFKLTNILVHIGTSTVVFAILGTLFRGRWLPLIGAALFCVHPLQVEAIGWASGLKDLLLAFFSTLCILFYLGDSERDFRLNTRAYVLAVVSMACACLSKPTALVLPAMLLVIDLWIARRGTKELLGRLLPFAIIGVACAAYARYAQPPIELETKLTLLDRLLVPLHTLAFYFGKLLWPTRLAFDYGVNWDYLVGSTRLYVAWIVPVCIAALAFGLRKRFPLLGPALLLAIIPIAPVSGLVVFDYSYYSITADHYLCLPMLGVVIAAIALASRVPLKWLMSAAAIVVVALGIVTTRQAMTWATRRTTLAHVLSVNPNSFSAYSVLAVTEVSESNRDPEKLLLAESYARKALELRPGHARSMNMLANVLAARGKFEDALHWVDQAIAKEPGDFQHHLARAGILGEMHRGPEAISELRTVLRLSPNNRLAKDLVKKWEETVELPAIRNSPTSLPAKLP